MASTTLSVESLEDRRLLSLSVPQYSSLPSAPSTLYLDFDGNYEAVWGGYQEVETPAYDLDGNTQSFNAQELAAIEEIWARVSEDFAPFNLNVTTIDPGGWSNPNNNALRVAIGGSHTDWFVIDASGAAHQNAYTNPLPNVVYVFEDDLFNGRPSMVADIASHEAGHAYGLRHNHEFDSNGNVIGEYTTGNSPEWAPLMGNSLFAERSTWYNGPSTSINKLQDDIAKIGSSANGFGFRGDDYGNSISVAASVNVSGSQFSKSGIIGSTGDADVFWFDTQSGNVTLTLDVAEYGANLDSRLELRSASGSIVQSVAPANELGASITANLAAGRYYAVVKSAGEYGDLGQYTLRGTLPSSGAPVANISGPSELVVGQEGTFVLEVLDGSGQTSSQQYNFQIDFDGDGLVDKDVQGTSGTVVGHTFDDIKTQQVSITAIATNGSSSGSASTTVSTVPYQLQADGSDPSKTNLVVGLSDGNDVATAFRLGSITGVYMTALNGQLSNELIFYTDSQVTGHVIIFGLGGDDYLTAEYGLPVEYYGGDGSDILIGSTGNDILIGGNGDDLLLGKSGFDYIEGNEGRDLLIGGANSDWLAGGSGDDLLVAGELNLGHQEAGIFAVWDEWRFGGGYLTRALHLTGISGGGKNGSYILEPGSSLSNDASTDYIFGNEGVDLFADIATNDLATDVASNEFNISQI